MRLGTYIYEYVRKNNFGSNNIWGQRLRSERSNVCEDDNSRKISYIVTKSIRMNLNWNRTKDFEDELLTTDPRSRSKRSNVQNIDVRWWNSADILMSIWERIVLDQITSGVKGQGHTGQMQKNRQLQPKLYIWMLARIGETSSKMDVLRATRGQGQRGQMKKMLTYANETHIIHS